MKVDVEGLEVNVLIGLGVSKDGSFRPNAIAIEDWSGKRVYHISRNLDTTAKNSHIKILFVELNNSCYFTSG